MQYGNHTTASPPAPPHSVVHTSVEARAPPCWRYGSTTHGDAGERPGAESGRGKEPAARRAGNGRRRAAPARPVTPAPLRYLRCAHARQDEPRLAKIHSRPVSFHIQTKYIPHVSGRSAARQTASQDIHLVMKSSERRIVCVSRARRIERPFLLRGRRERSAAPPHPNHPPPVFRISHVPSWSSSRGESDVGGLQYADPLQFVLSGFISRFLLFTHAPHDAVLTILYSMYRAASPDTVFKGDKQMGLWKAARFDKNKVTDILRESSSGRLCGTEVKCLHTIKTVYCVC